MGIVFVEFSTSRSHRCLAQTANHAITLNSRATILVDLKESHPIRDIAQNLVPDMQKDFSQAARIIGSQPDAGPITIVLDDARPAPRRRRLRS